MCLYWLQHLDTKCGSCSYMLKEQFRTGKWRGEIQQFQAAGTLAYKANRWLETAPSVGMVTSGQMAVWYWYLSVWVWSDSGCWHCCWGETWVSGIITPPRRCQALTGPVPIFCGSRRSCKSSSPGYPPPDFLSALSLIPKMPVCNFYLCCCRALSWITSYQFS